MEKAVYWAHISDTGKAQPISRHLSGAAALAKTFARPFGGEAQAELAALAHDIGKYSEALRYSDPVSSDELKEIEFELSQLIDELQKTIIEQEYEAAEVLRNKVMDILAERNRLCKLYK